MRTSLTLVAIMLGLPSCGPTDPSTSDGMQIEAAATAESPASAERLYVFDCGHLDFDNLDAFDRGGAYGGQPGEHASTCFLIRHPKGDLLWDTGLSDSINSEPGGIVGSTYRLSMPKTLKGQLAGIGVAPADIEYLSLSHSHSDHVGNANDYTVSTWIVESAERDLMFSDKMRANEQAFQRYSALENAKTIQIDGAFDVFGDGSVRIISTPGHTPGHASLLVTLKKAGPVLLAGDIYHSYKAREVRAIPTFNTDVEETLRSMDKFEVLAAETGARVIIQHEPDELAKLPVSPEFLD